jgi:DNA-binding NarL/FixJ family response regulator
VKILVLTSVVDPELLTRALEAGARGVLHKREAPSALLRAIHAIGEGEVFATQAATNRLFAAAVHSVARSHSHAHGHGHGHEFDAGRIASLTIRERQTIAAVTADASAPVKVIASRLCISEHTLRNHLTSIYSKLGVTGRLALHAYASQHGMMKTSSWTESHAR